MWIQGILFWVGLPDLGKTKSACAITFKLQENKESFSKYVPNIALILPGNPNFGCKRGELWMRDGERLPLTCQ